MSDAPKFRSVLPHEPQPTTDPCGYLHVQGSFDPRYRASKDDNKTGKAESEHLFWEKSRLEQAVLEGIRELLGDNDDNAGQKLQSVEVLDREQPFTKLRITLSCQKTARSALSFMKKNNVSPADVLQKSDVSNLDAGSIDGQPQFSTRPLQVTQVTTLPLPSSDFAWPRSNPPKFRRLLARPGDDPAVIAQERSQTRFVFMTGLLERPDEIPQCWNDSHAVADAIRSVLNAYDSSGVGVEVFVSNKKAALHCHIGMRSPSDASRLITNLQGQQVQWKVESDNNESVKVSSGKLFLDYADITHRSFSRSRRSEADGAEIEKGEPTRSECTSTTDSVVVPGLVLIPDFVSIEEEEVLMAVLVGPHAPWAPSQSTPSQHVVKRRVQHYGYVFDYETANVLRDRSLDKANCPPMPAIPDNASGMNVEDFIARSVHERRGFEALAGVIERVRKHDFSSTANENNHERKSSSLRFPNINQLTVNEYKPGSGIGSHVDTPTAFADGLISISLNSGVVMEFKRQSGTAENDGQPHRKLVYLPPRSLLLMSGPARYEWEHMIVTRSTDTHNGQVLPRGTRVSLTLRTALDDPSKGGIILPLIESCDFPPKWGTPTTTNGLATPATEREHVHAVYDAIATQWHHTRGKRGVLWPGATHFLQRLPPGSLVADIGCGDGKYFPAIWEAGSYVIGTDISELLLRMAVSASADEQGPDSRRISAGRSHLRDRPAVAVADCMNLPLRSKSFDAAICVAVMHHLSTEARRIRCIEELERIVKIGGTINIQAWAMEQQDGSRRTFHADDVFVPFNAQPKYLDRMKRSNGELKGSEITKSVAEMYSDAYEGAEFDERKGLVVFQRYCHLYRKGEMEELASRVPGLELIESGYESGNYYMILKVIES